MERVSALHVPVPYGCYLLLCRRNMFSFFMSRSILFLLVRESSFFYFLKLEQLDDLQKYWVHAYKWDTIICTVISWCMVVLYPTFWCIIILLDCYCFHLSLVKREISSMTSSDFENEKKLLYAVELYGTLLYNRWYPVLWCPDRWCTYVRIDKYIKIVLSVLVKANTVHLNYSCRIV